MGQYLLTKKDIFQSTHPARGATSRGPRLFCPLGNFNPRTPRGVRPGGGWVDFTSTIFQSTHPARGATRRLDNKMAEGVDFNPRTPRGVRRMDKSAHRRGSGDFNPRTPRGVRPHTGRRGHRGAVYFNPRTPRGVRLFFGIAVTPVVGISIHAPREGCDCYRAVLQQYIFKFQSTHPARGATFCHRSPCKD